MEKSYIIVGSNNFWYSFFTASTQKEIEIEMKNTREIVGEGSDNVLPTPNNLSLYEVKLIRKENI